MATSQKSLLPDYPVRVGIIAIWQHMEARKSEVVSMTRPKANSEELLRPWLESVRKEYIIGREEFDDVKGAPIKGVATDVACGAYIEWKYQNEGVRMDLIPPAEVTPERLAGNHLNFHILYDELEGFHGDCSKGKRVSTRIRECLDGADNMFPPRYYQKLINNKISYYNYFAENGIPHCPTYTMTREEMEEKELAPDDAADQFFDRIQEQNWFRFFCKPVWGVESRDAEMFYMVPPGQDDKKARTAFRKYFGKIMKKYPGIVIQKYMIGFGAHVYSPECRCVYVGDEFQMAMIQTDDVQYRPEGDERWFTAQPFVGFPVEEVRKFAVSVRERLPKMEVQGVQLPRLTTRVDVGTRPSVPGLPDLRTGIEMTLNKDAKHILHLCETHKTFYEDSEDFHGHRNKDCPTKLEEIVAGARVLIEKIDGGEYTVLVRYLDGPHKKAGKAGTCVYPIQALEGYNGDAPIDCFVNEVEYCPSLFVEETSHLIDQKLGEQMVKITRMFVKERRAALDARSPARKKRKTEEAAQPLGDISERLNKLSATEAAKGKDVKPWDSKVEWVQRAWTQSVRKARKALVVSGFRAHPLEGTPLHNQAMEFYLSS